MIDRRVRNLVKDRGLLKSTTELEAVLIADALPKLRMTTDVLVLHVIRPSGSPSKATFAVSAKRLRWLEKADDSAKTEATIRGPASAASPTNTKKAPRQRTTRKPAALHGPR
jgi:hypothetical protein